MPFLRDEGPPVSKETIQRARESLPLEFGVQSVNETGREVLMVRVPKAKPDYLHDISDVAFYVGLDQIKSTKDVLLIGHEKTARLEPQLLRDAIRQQDREDVDLVQDQRRRLPREYGQTLVQSPNNHQHHALAVRIPKGSVKEFGADDVNAIRAAVEHQKARFDACQYAYIVADRDHERLGRRVLLELIGAPATAPPPLPPAAPVATAPASAALSPFALPPTPGTAPPAAPAPAAAAPGNLPSWMRPRAPAPAAASAPAPAAPPAAPAPSLFTPPPAVAAPPPAPVAPAPAAAEAPLVDDREEYAIISKPKAAAPPPPPPAPMAAPPGAAAEVHDEYEIVSKPKAAAPPAEAAKSMVEDHPDVERSVHVATEAYEVYTSKPKPRPAGPAITPPGQGGFQAALANATSHHGHAPTKTKEYEIVGASHAPASAPIAPPVAAPPVRDDPRVQPAFQARAAAAPPPTPDNGIPVVPVVAPANPDAILAQRFKDAGYEVVEGLRAQGTVFAFAAHKPNGRRVLVKRAPDFAADDAPALAQLVAALGADLCLVVADRVGAGARLATWGTRIEVYASTDVPALAF